MNSRLIELAEPDWCDDCHNVVIPMPLWEYLLSRLCYRIVLWWPHRWFLSPAHKAVLPWAGNVAYRCICRRSIPRASTDNAGKGE